MRVIIAGGRDFNNYQLLKERCDYFFCGVKPDEIISGGNRVWNIDLWCYTGADYNGEKYAKKNDIPIKLFPYLKEYGKAGGPIRNRQMAEYATHLIAFWDGKSKGTKNIIDTANEFNLPTRIIRY